MDDRTLALLIFKAIHALKIDVPILSVVLLSDERIQLGLYGGGVVEYPPAEKTKDEGRTTKEKPDPAASKVVVARHACHADELVPVTQAAAPKAPRANGRAPSKRAVWGDKNHRSNVEKRQVASESVPPSQDIAPPKKAMSSGKKGKK